MVTQHEREAVRTDSDAKKKKLSEFLKQKMGFFFEKKKLFFLTVHVDPELVLDGAAPDVRVLCPAGHLLPVVGRLGAEAHPREGHRLAIRVGRKLGKRTGGEEEKNEISMSMSQFRDSQKSRFYCTSAQWTASKYNVRFETIDVAFENIYISPAKAI